MNQSRIGIFGGTFDPIHHGHLFAARTVAQECDLDSVLLTPAGAPWQKGDYQAKEHRLALTHLAAQTHPIFEVCDLEILRAGPSYSLDTLRQLRQDLPHAELFFILGADAFAGLASWHGIAELAQLCTFVAIDRPGHPAVAVQDEPVAGMQLLRVSAPTLNISSTLCRKLIQSGKPLDYLVPAQVNDYIKQHRLYLSTSD